MTTSALPGAGQATRPHGRQFVVTTDGGCPFQLAISDDTVSMIVTDTVRKTAPNRS
jgi:hypothetical protein